MDPMQERAAWQVKREAAIAEAVRLLTEVATEDLNHQIGVRGLDLNAGYTEASFHNESTCGVVRERVQDALIRRHGEVRRARSATRNTHGIEGK